MAPASTTVWILTLVGAFLVGFSKTGITAFGILVIAIFALVLPARESVGAILPLLVFADALAVLMYQRHADWGQLLRLLPWTAAGVLLGYLAMDWATNDVIRRFIGVLLLVLIGWQVVWRLRGARPEPADKPSSTLLAAATGILTGFTTMVANAAGPLMILYLLAMRLPKMEFVGTTAWFFLIVNSFKIPFSIHLNLVTPESLYWGLTLAPLVLLGALCGRVALHYIDQALFERLALLLTTAAAIRLLVP